jgi:hypothetical protein
MRTLWSRVPTRAAMAFFAGEVVGAFLPPAAAAIATWCAVATGVYIALRSHAAGA